MRGPGPGRGLRALYGRHPARALRGGAGTVLYVLFILYCTVRVCAGGSLGGAGGLGAGLAALYPAHPPTEVTLPLPRAAGRIQPPLPLIRGKGSHNLRAIELLYVILIK